MPAGTAGSRSITALGWLRLWLRIAALVAWLLALVPLYAAWQLFTDRNPWPRRFLAGVGRIAGVRIACRGVPIRKGAILLANHVSWLDIPALAAVTGTAFVGHEGLASVPLIRWLCTMNRTVFVARNQRSTIAGQVDDVRQAIRGNGALTLFPEGTTSDGTGLLPFKSALLSAIDPPPPGIAVQPVLLDYGAEAARIAWVGEEHGLDNFKRILARRRPLGLTLHFLPPLGGAALADRKTIAAAARSALLERLNG
jgi:lyso-ornithine lipid O-acyltransferase